MNPGGPALPRERITLVLPGKEAEMLPRGSEWVGRYSPDLILRQAGGDWVAYDGNGFTYRFTQDPILFGTGMWPLESIKGPGGAVVALEYSLESIMLPGAFEPAAAIDLVRVKYNPHPSEGCFKNEVALFHAIPFDAVPQALSVVGDRMVVRQHRLIQVDVLSRANCASAAQSLRRYALSYQVDPDTQQERLASVSMYGRDGTLEANESIPVASYAYGTATSGSGAGYALTYPATPSLTIELPAGADVVADTERDTTSLFASPISAYDKSYISRNNLIDMTGDGRPDLVFFKNDDLWIARNVPGPAGGTTFTAPALLTDNTFTHRYLEARSAKSNRFQGQTNEEYVWVQVIDVNGDGRLDIVDASQIPGYWILYINTPGTGPSGVSWVQRYFKIQQIYDVFASRGLAVQSGYLPLSRRFTGHNYREWECWRWDAGANHWVLDPGALDQQIGCYTSGQPPLDPPDPEATYVEWELKDINGDGYPDFVFNSSPVNFLDVGIRLEPEDHIPGRDYTLRTAEYRLRPIDYLNKVEVAFNVRGLFISNVVTQSYPFADPQILVDNSACGVELWSGFIDSNSVTQELSCGLVDVNGDGIVDRIEGRQALLGRGDGFQPQHLTLPRTITQESAHPNDCENAPPDTWSHARQLTALRDMTGDGIPDFVELSTTMMPSKVYVGTGAGFTGGLLDDGVTRSPGIALDINGHFTISWADERCNGDESRTITGLYDIDGDGLPESVVLDNLLSWHLNVYQLIGSAQAAGRLIRISNGYGASTSISYRSAKEDATTRHQVPFPEVVVSDIETNGSLGLGSALTPVHYAYGDIGLFYDSTIDAFRPTGYLRRVELVKTAGPGEPYRQGLAKIIDRYPLAPVTPITIPFMTAAQRFGRYLRAGQVKQISVLAGEVGADAWELLPTDISTDPRRIAGEDRLLDAYDTRLFADASAPSTDVCADIMFPYDFDLSVSNQDPGFRPCLTRGFLPPDMTTAWRGSAAPPSDANVQTETSVRSVDDYGRITSVAYKNDVFRSDDDLCVDTTYATPTDPESNARVLSAISSRKLWNCSLDGGGGQVYAEEGWEYDKLLPGLVSHGFVTAHTIHRHTTDTGTYLSTVREFDAWYDSAGNPINITNMREDGATHTTVIAYDPFGLAPVHTWVSGTNLPTLETDFVIDPLTSAVLSTTDENGTTRGTTFDGFERPVFDTVQSPNGDLSGVLAVRSYLGFEGGDAAGRRLLYKEFADPVAAAEVWGHEGRTTITYLDELGRSRFSEVDLGDDYMGEKLIVGARQYDQLGRVTFEADPYVSTQDASAAYGTTRYFGQDGFMELEVRGPGPQPRTTVPNASIERFPTTYQHSFASHLENNTTQDPDSLTSGSPQYNVRREAAITAVGQVVSRSTWRSTLRVEHAEFGYDHLGYLARMTRYASPSQPSSPVESSWRFDSLGQLLRLTEPTTAGQDRYYSDWGELKEVRWKPAPPEKEHSIIRQYDAFGRLIGSEERNDEVVDPDTVLQYGYDYAYQSPYVSNSNVLGRLSVAKGANGGVSVSYDSLGRVNARTFMASTADYVERHGFHADGSQAWIALELPDRNYAPERVDYAYDSAGRLRWMWYSDGTDTQQLYDATQMDPWGRLHAALFGHEVEYVANYSDVGRRLPQYVKVSSPMGTHSIEFDGFDAVGRELSRIEVFPNHRGSQSSSYDLLGRLQRSSTEYKGVISSLWSFSYDSLGNVTKLTDAVGSDDAALSYLTTDRDQICRIGYGNGGLGGTTCNVRYDSFGNVSSAPSPEGYQNTFSYFNTGDVRRISNDNRLSADLRYDPFGELQELEIKQYSTVLRSDRYHGAFITERTQNGPFGSSTYVLRSFPGPGLTISRRGANGPWVYQFAEPRGTRFTLDHVGTSLQDIHYSPYGQETSIGVGPGALTYSTRQWNDGDLLDGFGLVQLGKRVYAPAIGRFMSRDPLLIPRTSATTNPYAFAANDPVNLTDPTGLDFCAENPQCAATVVGVAVSLGMLAAQIYASSGEQVPPPSALQSMDQIGYYSGIFQSSFVDEYQRLRMLRWQTEIASQQNSAYRSFLGSPGLRYANAFPITVGEGRPIAEIGRVGIAAAQCMFGPMACARAGVDYGLEKVSEIQSVLAAEEEGIVPRPVLPHMPFGGPGALVRAAGSSDARIGSLGTGSGTAPRLPQDIAAGGGGGAARSFFEGTRYTPKVLQQMRGGPGEFHSFPESVTAFESAGTVRTITGGDGVARQMLEIPGSYATSRGTVLDGVFQFIKEADGAINHRLFVPRTP